VTGQKQTLGAPRSTSDGMSVLQVLKASTEYLSKHTIDQARLNAEHLLAHVLGRTRIELYLEFERELGETELAPLRELVRRRGEGEPLQHLLGTVEFCGLTFLCDKRALVPRPETEELVELLVSEVKTQKAEIRILDVGTGSGVIALSLASKFPDARIVGVDVSEDALALARENAAWLGLTGRVEFRQGDLLQDFTERFDVIVANLPYIARSDRPTLSREVLRDPEIALFAGEQGDGLIRRLIDQAPAHLEPGGLLALEIGLGQAEGLAAFLPKKIWRDIEPRNDYQGVTRFLFARYG
jgi:release factor glutamine methyltransferase